MTSRIQLVAARPNVLHGETIPNTLGGIGLPARRARPTRARRPLVAAATVILAGLALLLTISGARAF